MTNINEEGELLQILQAHGEQFLGSFSLSQQNISRKRKRKQEIVSDPVKCLRPSLDEDRNSEDDEEWGGITEHSVEGRDGNLYVKPEIKRALDSDEKKFTAESSSASRTNVVVFNDFSSPKNSNITSKTLMKAFMSSKVSKLRQDIPAPSEPEEPGEGIDDERSNAQNDALLHRLVHTELLSGYSNPELNLSSARRRKALAGRVLELSGGARIGKGQKSVIEKERNKASKRVRDGLLEKQNARVKQELEVAKNLGNYHPTIKNLFGSSTSPVGAKRDRGLRMGVGKFSGGLLKLSQREVTLAQGGQGERNSNRGRHNRGRKQ